MSYEINEHIGEPLHPDFQKILQQFITRYGQKQGTDYFWGWVTKLGLQPDKAYGWSESFTWLEPSDFKLIRQDAHAKYYEVEAAFPLTSMNDNIYTRAQLAHATAGLQDKPVNLDHDARNKMLPLVTIPRSKWAGDASQLLLRVDNRAGQRLGLNIQKMIDDEEIIHVSLEGDCEHGNVTLPTGYACIGFEYSGLALLTRAMLPGIPLTRIMPLEHVMDLAEALRHEAKWTTAYINSLPNSSFAAVEPDYLSGKTQNKNARHLPYKDASGKIDLAHLQNALARMNQIQPVTSSISAAALRQKARAVLIPLARRHFPGSQWARLTVIGVDKMSNEPDGTQKTAPDKPTRPQSQTARLAKAELELSELRRKNRKLEQDNTKLSGVITGQNESLAKLGNEVEDLHTKLGTAEAKLETAGELHENLVKELSGKSAKLSEVEKRLEKLAQEHSDLVTLAESIQQKLDNETDAHSAAACQNLVLTEKLTKANNDVIDLQAQVQDLTERLKKAKRGARLTIKA